MQWKNSPSEYKYNIFWSEMSTPTKLAHIVKQMFIFLILPLVVLATTFNRCLYAKWPMDACFPCSYFIRESQIPVNRFSCSHHSFTNLLFHEFTISLIYQFTNFVFQFWLAEFDCFETSCLWNLSKARSCYVMFNLVNSWNW